MNQFELGDYVSNKLDRYSVWKIISHSHEIGYFRIELVWVLPGCNGSWEPGFWYSAWHNDIELVNGMLVLALSASE